MVSIQILRFAVLSVVLLSVAAQAAEAADEESRGNKMETFGKTTSGKEDRKESYGKRRSLVVPPTEVPYEGLTLDWWRWALESNPFTFQVDKCAGNQIYTLPDKKTPVFFLAGVEVINDTLPSVDVFRQTDCNVPKNAYLMIPAINSASALDPKNESSFEVLTDGITTTRNSTDYLLDLNVTSWLKSHSIEVDRKLVTTKSFTILSELEPFTVPAVGAEDFLGQSYGSWNLLRPLSPGRHEVRICSSIDVDPEVPGIFRFCVTYALKVDRKNF
jgi:hypothetical protein